ncbi:MAG: hypothetical protein Q8J85_07160 [Sulfuricurvum sp.]|nr:hypothetical protein [Sulfuricurvum sp.]MDP3022995.1 hypothetical protein [Sulfuricurvum sp.]
MSEIEEIMELHNEINERSAKVILEISENGYDLEESYKIYKLGEELDSDDYDDYVLSIMGIKNDLEIDTDKAISVLNAWENTTSCQDNNDAYQCYIFNSEYDLHWRASQEAMNLKKDSDIDDDTIVEIVLYKYKNGCDIDEAMIELDEMDNYSLDETEYKKIKTIMNENDLEIEEAIEIIKISDTYDKTIKDSIMYFNESKNSDKDISEIIEISRLQSAYGIPNYEAEVMIYHMNENSMDETTAYKNRKNTQI